MEAQKKVIYIGAVLAVLVVSAAVFVAAFFLKIRNGSEALPENPSAALESEPQGDALNAQEEQLRKLDEIRNGAAQISAEIPKLSAEEQLKELDAKREQAGVLEVSAEQQISELDALAGSGQ